MANALFDALTLGGNQNDQPLLNLPGGAQWSRRTLFDRAAQYAAALHRLGVQPEDRVAAQVPKSAEAVALYLACVQAGFVFLPLNTAYTPSEIEYFVADAEPAVLVLDPASLDSTARQLPMTHRTQTATLDADGGGSLSRLADDESTGFPTRARATDDLVAILYTSGTTGRAKGAMLTQDNLLSNALTLRSLWGFTEQDVLLHALPIYHTHGLFVAINTVLCAGASLLFLPRFELQQLLDLLPRATTMMGVPTFYTRLLADPRFDADLVRHVRLFVSGSAPLLAETHREFEARTGQRILERYGMTETNMITSNPYQGERRAGTVGFPLPGVDVQIRDQQTHELIDDGSVGMIEVRGPNVFKGYWRMPEKTAEEFTPDGYFITGDLGCWDRQGYLQIVGRDKDLVISGGFNVYPKEVELGLDEQPGVIESAVIGVPHPDFGEAVVAYVVLDQDAPADPAALSTALGHRLARFKQPKRILPISELPRNTMGKVQKNRLREQAQYLFTSLS